MAYSNYSHTRKIIFIGGFVPSSLRFCMTKDFYLPGRGWDAGCPPHPMHHIILHCVNTWTSYSTCTSVSTAACCYILAFNQYVLAFFSTWDRARPLPHPTALCLSTMHCKVGFVHVPAYSALIHNNHSKVHVDHSISTLYL